ncbi:MAG: hypothetical protein HKL80_07660 [Acidimicrobiales bacterium]|nr:hypothetical protein [Acidimicrobiales bacterium]
MIATLFAAPIVYYTFNSTIMPSGVLSCGVFSPSGCIVIYRINFVKFLIVLIFTFIVIISLIFGSIPLTKSIGSRKSIKVLGFLSSMGVLLQPGLILVGVFLMFGINSQNLSNVRPTIYEDFTLFLMVLLNSVALIIAVLIKPLSYMARRNRVGLQISILLFGIGLLAVFSFSPSNFLNGSANGYREAHGVFSGYSSSALNVDCPTLGNCISVIYGGNTASVITSSDSKFYIADKIDASNNGVLFPSQISCSSVYLCAVLLRNANSETSHLYLGITRNFGKSFSTVLTLPYSPNDLPVLRCRSTSACYFIYGDTYYSGNGGANWTDVNKKTSLSSVVGLACLNNTSCLVKVATNSRGLLYRTTDSGTTWSKLHLTGYLPAGPIRCGLGGKCFLWSRSSSNQNSLILIDLIAGSYQQLAFNPLGGLNNGGTFPIDFQCRTSINCVALLESSSDTHQLSLWITSNGGINWKEEAVGTYQLTLSEYMEGIPALSCPTSTTCKFLVVNYSQVSSGSSSNNFSDFEYPTLMIASITGDKLTMTNLP